MGAGREDHLCPPLLTPPPPGKPVPGLGLDPLPGGPGRAARSVLPAALSWAPLSRPTGPAPVQPEQGEKQQEGPGLTPAGVCACQARGERPVPSLQWGQGAPMHAKTRGGGSILSRGDAAPSSLTERREAGLSKDATRTSGSPDPPWWSPRDTLP